MVFFSILGKTIEQERMSKGRYIMLLAFFVVMALPGCCGRRAVAERLDIAAAVMEAHPDSALTVVRSIAPSELRSSPLRARHSLLHAIALDKCYIDTTDLSIIQPAVDWYSRNGTQEEKMRTSYQRGIIYLNAEQYPEAAVHLSQADTYCDTVRFPKEAGLICARLATIFNRVYNHTEELEYARRAFRYFQEVENPEYWHHAKYQYAQALSNNKRFDEAERMFKEIIDDSRMEDYIVDKAKTGYALLLIVREKRDSKEACRLFSEVVRRSGSLSDANYWGAYAFSMADSGDLASSEQLFTSLFGYFGEDPQILYWKAKADALNGKYLSALKQLSQTLDEWNSKFSTVFEQSTSRAQRDYYQQQEREEAIKAGRWRTGLMVLLLLVVLLVSAFVRMIKMRSIKHQRMQEILIGSMESLRSQTAQTERDMASLRDGYVKMYRAQFNALNDLCETVLLSEGMTQPYHFVFDRVKNMTRCLREDPEGQKEFERMINKTQGNILHHFRESFPKRSEEDYRFVSFMIAGFDSRVLSLIFDLPIIEAAYQKRARMRKMLDKAPEEYKDQFMQFIK
ncbi:MAG: hypothetical protein J6Z35_07765 [Lachnospiraceae bacterium]|nr:hypothetical protein [Lachnospiraceae bacterium]